MITRSLQGDCIAAPLSHTWLANFQVEDNGQWMMRMPDQGISFYAQGTYNLDILRPSRFKDQVFLYQQFTSEEAGERVMGIGADWWCQVYLNGELCFSSMDRGNQYGAFRATDYPFYVQVKKGSNLLAIRVVRGSGPTWSFACDGTNRYPPEPRLLLGPWLCNPDTGTMSVRFITTPNVIGYVEYRRKGDGEWMRQGIFRHGQMVRTDHHLIRLENLAPGADYEYRLVLQGDGFSEEMVDESVFSFHSFDANQERISFVFTADLQYPFDIQTTYIRNLFEAAEARDCDFVVIGGDLVQYENIRDDLLFEPIREIVQRGDCAQRPLVYIRGNHEMRGLEASAFLDYFAFANGCTYAFSRMGTTAFLALDTWEDKPRESHSFYNRFNNDREFLQEEAAFLEKVMARSEWTEAHRRIVLAHGAPYSNFDSCLWQPFRVQELTDRWFHGKHPVSPLDMWLCGHSHVHLRSIPGTNQVAAPVEPPAPHRTGEEDIFPVLTVGGPATPSPVKASVYRVDIEADQITVKAYDQDGTLIDHVVYSGDHGCQELMQVPHFAQSVSLASEAYSSLGKS